MIALAWLKIAWAWLKTIPWEVYAVVIIMVLVWGYGRAKYDRGYKAAETEYTAKAAASLDRANKAAREKERLNGLAIDAIESKYIMERALNNEIYNKTIADLRDGSSRVRDKFKCKAGPMPAINAGAGRDHATDQAGFTDQDAEIAFRIAADGDAAIGRLTACQAILTADRAN